MKPDYMVWNESYSIGYDKADDQHKKIISIINQIYQLQQSNDTEKLLQIVTQLKDYAFQHFMMEEFVMFNSNYPNIKRHKEQHQKFRETINEIQFQYKHDLEKLYRELLIYLKDWWERHIQTADRAYVPYARTCKKC